jgi:hypothetical protein
MEIGNLVFGHSRGEYSMDRDGDWESELAALFHRIDPNSEVPDFENDVFAVRRYWWGDCECGWEEFSGGKKESWHKENCHAPNCYKSLVKKDLIERGWAEDRFGVLENQREKDTRKSHSEKDSIEKKWCRRLGLTYPDGCAVHCTCDYDDKWGKFVAEVVSEFGGGDEGHKKTCPIVLPNFLYKPTGFEIRWYKYPLRDSYKNQDIGLKDFVKIIDHCIRSLRHV